ncbi:hypothetical protein ILP97_07525 [Amycolatopsis sp. H6(2020)]|nr:hypothetical protein [Amycolatopsis sp. H6(2020)]
MSTHRAATGFVPAAVAVAAIAVACELDFGRNQLAGVFAATIGSASLIGVLGRRDAPDEVVIGSSLVWMLGVEVFFLLFAGLGPGVGAARGVPVRFLALAGAGAAEATRTVGALLLLGLLATPAATAHRLSGRPCRALALSAVAAPAGTRPVSKAAAA